MEIKFAIEGEQAVEATKSLLDIPELIGEWQPVDEEQREPNTIATIASIVGIVGGSVGIISGTITIGEKILKWFRKGKTEGKIENVVLISSNGNRLLLEDAKPEDICNILRELPTKE